MPVLAAVEADPDTGASAAGVEKIGVAVKGPGGGDEFVGVGRVHHHFGDAGAGVDVQDFAPGPAAVGSFVHAAFFVRGPHITHRADVGHVRIGRVWQDAVDVAGGFEAHVLPGRAAVEGLVDAAAVVGRVAGVALPGAGPDDTRVGVGNGYGTNAQVLVAVENRRKADAAVLALPEASGGGADVDIIAVVGVDVDGGYAAGHAGWAYVSWGQGFPVVRFVLGEGAGAE